MFFVEVLLACFVSLVRNTTLYCYLSLLMNWKMVIGQLNEKMYLFLLQTDVESEKDMLV